MGLRHSERYGPTSHFKDRLAERFNIHGASWQLFMRQLYPKLEYDERLSTRNTQKADVYHARKKGIYVVVDPKNYKLITIFKNITDLEQEIGLLLDEDGNEDLPELTDNDANTNKTEYNKDMNDLINFAHDLLKEEAVLRTQNKFKYSQKVLQVNKDVIDEFISHYKDVLESDAIDEFIHKMNRLKKLQRKIGSIFENIELPTK